MKKDFKIIITEKGQGLIEYVLILAFIAGLALMIFSGGGSLKGAVVSTFSETSRLLGSLFEENNKSYYPIKLII